MRQPAAALLLLLACAAPVVAQEAPRVPLRAGSHPGHGRLVFDWTSTVPYTVEQAGDRVVVRFGAPARLDLDAARRPPRNVLGVEEEDGAVVIRAVPGVRLRHFRVDNRVVVDLLDPPASRNAETAPEVPPAGRRAPSPPVVEARTPTPAPPQAAAAEPRAPVTPRATPEAAAAPRAAPEAAVTPRASPGAAVAPRTAPEAAAPPRTAAPAPTATVTAPRPSSAPAAEAAPAAPVSAPEPTNAPSVPAMQAPAATPSLPAPDATPVRAIADAPAIAVPAEAGTGLALFRRGETLYAVFDRVLPLDLAPLRGHPLFAGLEALPAGDGTLLRLRLAAPARFTARRDSRAWIIEATRDAQPDGVVLRAEADPGPPGRLVLRGGLDATAAGGVIALTDPDTGEPLLVATLRRPGPGVAIARRMPELDLLPTMMGAAVVARSDRIALRPAEDRILVQAAAGGSLALGAATGREPPVQVLAMSRLLSLPVGSVSSLMERLRVQLLAVNEAPPLSRGPLRRDVAETLLALGMPQEAQAMAGMGLREDPQAREDARLLLVQGVAALLAGRPAEARGIADPRLPANDEVSLWRALLAVADGDAAAASALVAGAPLLLDYPDPLRARLLPLAAEAMAAGGEANAVMRLIADAGDLPGLDLARAMLAESAGRPADALEGYATVARGRDRRQRAAALRRSAELRLATGETDSAGAATELEQALFAWRGGPEEVALRRRIAALRLAAGQGAQAFALLDETARLFPDQADAVRGDLSTAFAAALETAPPVAAATLFDAHPDMLPEGERGEAAVQVLAERLAALDLPARAAALLERAASRTDGPLRAGIGVRLAALRMGEGDAAGALAALDSTRSEGLPESLATRRALLRARALARRGARQEAETILAGLGPAGAEARAELHAEARDWTAAAAAQRDHLAASLPPAPAALGPTERAAIARAAAYAALAGDEAALAALRAEHGARMEGGPLAEAFGVLTSDPLRGVADLPRLQREIGMMRVMPSRLEALRGPVQVAR